MILYFKIALLVALAVILYQDLKNRSIHWIPLLIVFIASISIWYLNKNSNWKESLFILAFLSLIALMILLFYRLKYGKDSKQNIQQAIGMGDVLFILAIVPLFGLHNFIYFFSAGMIFSLVVFAVVNMFKKVTTIPLAGYLSAFLIIVQLTFYFVDDIDPYIPIYQ